MGNSLAPNTHSTLRSCARQQTFSCRLGTTTRIIPFAKRLNNGQIANRGHTQLAMWQSDSYPDLQEISQDAAPQCPQETAATLTRSAICHLPVCHYRPAVPNPRPNHGYFSAHTNKISLKSQHKTDFQLHAQDCKIVRAKSLLLAPFDPPKPPTHPQSRLPNLPLIHLPFAIF